MIKFFLTLVALLTLNGCLSTSESYYVLSMPSKPTHVYTTKIGVIGIEKVTIPGYLYKREIAIAENENKITLREDAEWGEDLDSGLTQRLIVFLQEKFNHPHVYTYPWGIVAQPDIKVAVKINRFIAQGSKVYLDASFEVLNVHTHKRKAELFSTSVPTDSDMNSVVIAMNKAFGNLEEKVASVVHRF